MRVLLTRPASQSLAFSANIDPRFEVIISPVFEIRFLNPDVDFSRFDALAFTSQNGVRAFEHLGGPKGMKAFCVGSKTAALAAQAGLRTVSADGDITALNALLDQKAPYQRLLHIGGVHTAGDVLGDVTKLVAYDQLPCALSEHARAELAKSTDIVVPLFSPRTADLFQAQIDADVNARLHAICMSEAVADRLDDRRFSSIETCDAPTAAAMRDKMSEIFPVRSA